MSFLSTKLPNTKKRKTEVPSNNENTNPKNAKAKKIQEIPKKGDTSYFTERFVTKKVDSSQLFHETNASTHEVNISKPLLKPREFHSKPNWTGHEFLNTKKNQGINTNSGSHTLNINGNIEIPIEKRELFSIEINELVKTFETKNLTTILAAIGQDRNEFLSDRTNTIFSNLKIFFKDKASICSTINNIEEWNRIKIQCEVNNWNRIECSFYNNNFQLAYKYCSILKENTASFINKKNLLHEAIIKNQIFFVELFLHYGADINKRDQYNFTPYDIALIYGHEKIQKIISQQKDFKNNEPVEKTSKNEDFFDYLDEFLDEFLDEDEASILWKESISSETDSKEIFA